MSTKIKAVFHNEGQPVLRTTVTDRIRYHLGEAGYPKGATPHVLRHLYEPVLRDASIPRIATGRYMGHAPTGSMGGERYTHVMRGVQIRVRNALDIVWCDAQVPPVCPAAWERAA